MSWEASAWAKKITVCPNGQKITRSEKFLLLVLADYHNTELDAAWASIRTLAQDILSSERQCRYLIRSLERKNIITTKRGSGVRTSFYYLSMGQSLPLWGATVAPPEPVDKPVDNFVKGGNFACQGGQFRVSRGAIAIAPKPEETIRNQKRGSNFQKLPDQRTGLELIGNLMDRAMKAGTR